MVFVSGGPRGDVGGLCRAIVVELTRGGAGGVPLDTARSTLVSNLFVGETPGDGSAAWFVPGRHGPEVRTVGAQGLPERENGPTRHEGLVSLYPRTTRGVQGKDGSTRRATVVGS